MPATSLRGIEINPKLVGAIFTDTNEDVLRVFCLYVNGDTYEFEVPVDENHESLHALYAQLDMLDKCNSAIVEQIVQGRFYAKDEKAHWMYTILATNGSCAPRIDSNIQQLSWRRIWAAKGTEVLLLGNRRRNHCYAVRTEITEEDLHHTLKHSRAFINPTPPKGRHAVPMVALAAMLVMAGLLAGGAAWWKLGRKHPLVVHAAAAKTRPTPALTVSNPVAPPQVNYFLLKAGTIEGPFPAPTLRKWRETGELTPESMIRREGELDWFKVDELLK